MGIRLGPDVMMVRSSPTIQADVDALAEMADRELGLSDVQLIMLPRPTNLLLDVLNGVVFGTKTQIATIAWTSVWAWVCIALATLGSGGLIWLASITWVSMLWMLWSDPFSEAYWDAKRKQLGAYEAERIRKLYQEKARALFANSNYNGETYHGEVL